MFNKPASEAYPTVMHLKVEWTWMICQWDSPLKFAYFVKIKKFLKSQCHSVNVEFMRFDKMALIHLFQIPYRSIWDLPVYLIPVTNLAHTWVTLSEFIEQRITSESFFIRNWKNHTPTIKFYIGKVCTQSCQRYCITSLLALATLGDVKP